MSTIKKTASKCKERVLYHWKTSVVGLFIAIYTYLLLTEKVTAPDYTALITGIAAIVGLLMKDWDKKNNCDHDGEA